MKAIVMVGGFGTRLRPFTLTVPKPLVDFANKPIIDFIIEACIEAGVSEIILATGYFSEQLEEHILHMEKNFNIKITFSQEDKPLGTAGPLKFAEKLLKEDN